MFMVKLYDVFVRKIYIDGVHITVNFRADIVLPIMVTGTLCYIVNGSDSNGLPAMAGF